MKVFGAHNTQNGTPSSNKKKNESAPFFGVQTKLTIGKPNDKYEKEADAVADKVVSKSSKQGSFFGNGSFFSPNPTAKVQRAPFEEIQQKEETDEIQEKPLAETITPVVQLASDDDEIQEKCSDCEKEEQKVQKMPFEDVQQKKETARIQPKCSKCAEKEKIQKKEGNTFPALPEGVLDEKEKEEMPQEVAAETKEEAPKADAGEKAPQKAAGNDLKPPVREEKEEIQMPPIQEKSDGASKQTDISQSLSNSKGKGDAMNSGTLDEMNAGFGTDFSNVRVHTDSNAVQMNKDLGAQAFTNGNDIYFNQGKYDPNSSSGKHLLAHELTHTVQQGASGNNIQKCETAEKKASPEGKPEKPNDGAVVEGKSNNKINNDENVKNQSDLDADEIKEKKDPPRGEVHAEKGSVIGEGISTPPVDRGGEAAAKIEAQKAEMNEQLSAEPAAGEGEGKTGEGEAKSANMGEADVAEQKAASLLAQANSIPIPAKPQPFNHPNVIAPVDSVGEPIPRQANIDTQVRGLGYIAEMLREKGYEMMQHASEKDKQASGTEASIETSKKDLALSKEGTGKFEQHNEERKAISETSKKALDESNCKQAFVAGAAPELAQEADQGKAESGSLASESNAKASESQSKIPDDPDAKADAQKQSGEMGETASGAQSMDDAITQTGERARKYIQDAEQASKDNTESNANITENDAIVEQIDGKVESFKAMNAASDAQIAGAAGGPDIIRKQAQGNRAAGEKLIGATIVMELELITIQDKYLAGMKAIESREVAQKRLDKEAKEKQDKEATPEEAKLYAIAGASEEEQQQEIDAITPEEKPKLMSALDKMISETPDDGTAETEGKRKEFKFSKDEAGPGDPRQEQITAVDNERVQSLGGVMTIADQNMSQLSVEQQKMLAERLVGESIVDDVKNISVAQMAKGMIEGMINPMVGIKGVVDGLEKTFSGVANIFNADAWSKDPLGNLLQIGADISTGLAMVFSSILGIAGMITALMVALTIISWGTLSPITGPVIGWMGTVMTYAGWGAIISGSLSVYFNSLAYIKNLNDAGTAETASELFGNVEQMKKNASDGMTGAMAIVEGVGAVKMGPVMKSGAFMKNVPKSPGAFAKQTMNGAKEGLQAIAGAPSKIAKGAKKLFSGGKKGLQNFKKKLQGFFSKSKSKTNLDLDGPQTPKQNQKSLESSKKKKSSEVTQSEAMTEVKAAKDQPVRDVDPDTEFGKDYDMEVEVNGHTYRKRKDGKGWCRFTDKPSACEIDLPDDGKALLDSKAAKKKDAEGLIDDNSQTFKDKDLEDAYQRYVERKTKSGDTIRDRADWKVESDWWKENSPVARGNQFNKKAADEGWYPYDEVHLSNGKRLDGYDPPGSIISRKHTDLGAINDDTFLGYLKEMKDKYPRGTTIRSNKYPDIDGQPLKGKYYLEIPASNKNLPNIDHYKQIARENGITLRFRPA